MCTKNHASEKCRFKNAICFRCRQKGHIATACSRAREDGGEKRPVAKSFTRFQKDSVFSTGSRGHQANWCDTDTTSDPEWEAEDHGVDASFLETGHQQVLVLGQPTGKPPLTVTVEVNGKPLVLEV